MPRLTILLILAAMALPTNASAPCCAITGIDAKNGVASARETATGRTFQFKVNAAQLKALRVGSPVYANFAKKQVSLDGALACCAIVGISGGKPEPAYNPVDAVTGAKVAPAPGFNPVDAATDAKTLPPSALSGSGNSNAPLLPLRIRPVGSTSALSGSGNSNAPPVSPLCSQSGGTSNPLTQDNFSKAAAAATFCFTASCGASTTISGNVFPAGSSDWLLFTVPAPRENCAMPVINVSISSSGGFAIFDVLALPGGPAVTTSYGPGATAMSVPNEAGLGTVLSPLQPGSYYIRIYGMNSSSAGTWTLKIAS